MDEGGVCRAKTCSDCHKVLDVNLFNKSKTHRFGIRNDCRECSRNYSRKYGNAPAVCGVGTVMAEKARQSGARNSSRTAAEIQLDREKLRPSGTKKCRTCKHELTFDLFYANRRLKDGLNLSCRVCDEIVKKIRREKKFVSYWNSRNVPIECYVCGGPYEHTDHVIPLALGGPDSLDNVLPMCALHNLSKGDTMLDLWLLDKFPGKSDEILRKVTESYQVKMNIP